MPSQRLLVRRYLWRLAEVVSLIVLIVLVCLAFVKLVDYVLPFVIGAFFAMLLLPLSRMLERRGVRRNVSVVAVLAAIVLLLIGLSTYLAITVAREATMWTQTITNQFSAIQEWVTDKVGYGKEIFGQLPPAVSTNVEQTATGFVTTLQHWLTGLAGGVIHVVTTLPESMFVVVIAIIATYFMMVNRDKMYEAFLRALPPGWSDKVSVVTNDMMKAFVGTIRAQVVLMLMSAVLGVIGMWICGINYAVLLGVLFGVTGLVPILGSAILTVPWAAGALVVGDVPLALKVLLLQVAISLIRHVVEPKILAESVGLDTLSTLFALYVGMKLMGVLGLFLGPIVLIGIKSLLRIRLFMDLFPVPDIILVQSVQEARGDEENPAENKGDNSANHQATT